MVRALRASAIGLFLMAGALGLLSAPVMSAQPVRVPDLDGKLVDPFQRPFQRPSQSGSTPSATVLLFASVDCPISNRYAPDIRKMHDAFAAKGVAFWLVYPNPRETPAAIRRHLADFNYPIQALRDPKHELAALAKATVTPEAAVYDQHGALVYHGRIDDRYVSLGVERPAATRHDLQDALTAVVSNRAVPAATQPAVGCFIADFVP